MTGRRLAALVLFDLVSILMAAGFVALAVWQVERRAWKLDLIARVDARVHALAVAAPGPARWPGISAADDEYRRVTATGRWLDDRSALVRAVTERGEGYWVLTPLARDDGTTIFVNRGFVPEKQRDKAAWRAPDGPDKTVIGLLRLSEPHGGLLRANDPATDRWFSRDIPAIAGSRGLVAAPYFIDAERAVGATPDALPVGGLTVVAFSNNHLVYAVTWSILALMALAGTVFASMEIWKPGRLTRRTAEG